MKEELSVSCNVYVDDKEYHSDLKDDFFSSSAEDKTAIDMFILQLMIFSNSSYEDIEEIFYRGLNRVVDYVNICNDNRTLNPVKDRETLLMMVARSKDYRENGSEITKLLLKWGADINAKNSSNFSAKEIAYLTENWRVLGVLVDNE